MRTLPLDGQQTSVRFRERPFGSRWFSWYVLPDHRGPVSRLRAPRFRLVSPTFGPRPRTITNLLEVVLIQSYWMIFSGSGTSLLLKYVEPGLMPSDAQIRLQARRERFRRLFRGLYPWCNTAFELWLLAYNVAYLFDKSPFYRPWLAWMGLDIRRARAVIEVRSCTPHSLQVA